MDLNNRKLKNHPPSRAKKKYYSGKFWLGEYLKPKNNLAKRAKCVLQTVETRLL